MAFPGSLGEWDPNDVIRLKQMLNRRTALRVMALRLGRSEAAIQEKAMALGVPVRTESDRQFGRRR